MGNTLSVDIGGLIFGCWDRCSRRATCIWQLEHNLNELDKLRQELTAKKNDLIWRVSREEERYLVRLEVVDLWLAYVDADLATADELLSKGRQEIQKLCLGGCCSMNCIFGLKFASKVLDEVNYLADRLSHDFETVALPRPAVVHAQMPGDQPLGLEAVFNKVWRWLVEENIGIVGLSGMGGVGKTTLLKQIYKHFSATRKDLELIRVVVSREFSLDKVQEEIGERLGLCHDEQWTKQRVDRKAVSKRLSSFWMIYGKQ